MRLHEYLFRARKHVKNQRPAPKVKKHRRRLWLEQLEDRVMPTILISPHYGVEAQTQDGGFKLNSPPVHLIFWGQYWNGTSSPQATAIINAASSLISSTYFNLLTQYGINGQVFLGGDGFATAVWDNDGGNNPSNFSTSDIAGVIENQIDNGPLPESDTPANLPIYVVVTPPNAFSNSGTGVAGFNFDDTDTDICGIFCIDHDHIPSAWVWSGNNSNSTVNTFQFQLLLSHEMGEIMTDEGGGGFEVNPGASWTGPGSGNQIGDYEGNFYSLQLPNGAWGQPLWSRRDNAWGFSDGTNQVFNLTGNWQAGCCNFNGNYALTINGDQVGSPTNDTLTIDRGANGGVQVTLNGETVNFFFGGITSITVNLGGGNDIINVERVISGVPITINLGSGNDVVNIGPSAQNLGNIRGNITVNGGAGSDTLNVDDQSTLSGETWTMTGSSVADQASATITYFNIHQVNINGGSGNNTYNIQSTEFFGATNLNPGPSNDAVNVFTTSGPLTINCDGVDTVNVGDQNGVQDIKGTLVVNGFFDQPILNLNDAGDPTPRNGTITATAVTGLAPATISFGSLNQLNIIGDSSPTGSIFDVQSTPAPFIVFGQVLGSTTTTINSNTVDTINVGDQNGVQDIQGNLVVNGVIDNAILNLNDAADPSSRTATITVTAVTGLAPATISFGNLSQLNITGDSSSAGNTFNVQSTPAPFIVGHLVLGSTTTTVNTNAADTINVGDVNGVQDIQGNLVVNGILDRDTLNLNDWADLAPRTVSVTNTAVTGLAPASISYTVGVLNALNLNRGSGGNTFNVLSTDQPLRFGKIILGTTTTTINSAAADTINVGDQNGAQDIQGVLVIHGASPLRTLNLNDTADTAARVATVTSTAVTGLAPATISFDLNSLKQLSILGGSGGNTVNVQSTAAGTTTSIDTDHNTNIGSTNNTVNIGSIAPSLGGTLATIAGPVNVSNSSGTMALVLDDSGDITTRTATITSTSVTGTWSAAAINYIGKDVSSLTLHSSGNSPKIFNVLSTSTTTNLALAGFTSVRVGNAGSVQGISGSLNIENPTSLSNTIVVDDSADTTARTVTLSTLGTNPADSQANTDPWGQIIGLAPAHINYEYADNPSLTIKGGSGGNTFNILAVASPTTINGTGNNTFDVGSDGTFAGSVKNITNSLTLNGGGGSNSLTLDDSGNTTTIDTVSLTPTSAGGSSFFGTSGSLTYSAISSVTLQASNASVVSGLLVIGDNISVTPQTGILFTINGGNPPAGSHPGDRLTLSLVNGGVTIHPGVAAGSGFFTFTGSTTHIVNYTGIETPSPAGWLVVGADAGGKPEVKVFNAQSGQLKFDFLAFDPSFHGGVRVAVGDVNGDGIPDIITAEGPGGEPLVHVYDGITGKLLAGPLGSFDAFDPSFHGGLWVASADVNGDGYADIVVGEDAGGEPRVRVFSGQTGQLLDDFLAFDPSFHGGVRVAASDLNHDGKADVIVGLGSGGPPLVQVFEGAELSKGLVNPVLSFDAFDPGFAGGVYVAAGDIHADGFPKIIVGEGPGGQSLVSVFDGITGQQLESFRAFQPGLRGGVRVAAADVNSDGRSDIVTAEGPGGLPRVRGWDGFSLKQIDEFFAFDPNFRDGVFVAGGGRWG
jgi:hypothetical protein